MYVSTTPRSLISYKDLRANNIHISTTVESSAEILELQQGQQHLATATGGVNGLHKIVISFKTIGQNSAKREDDHSLYNRIF